MVEGKKRDEWERTAHLRCQIANSFRIADGPTFTPDDFDPFAEEIAKPVVEKIPFKLLKDVLF